MKSKDQQLVGVLIEDTIKAQMFYTESRTGFINIPVTWAKVREKTFHGKNVIPTNAVYTSVIKDPVLEDVYYRCDVMIHFERDKR